MSGLLELGRATDDFPARPSIDQPTGSRFGASPPSPGQGGEEDPREDAHARHRDERPQHVRQRARPRLEAARVQLRRRARAPVRRSRHGRREENEQAQEPPPAGDPAEGDDTRTAAHRPVRPVVSATDLVVSSLKEYAARSRIIMLLDSELS